MKFFFISYNGDLAMEFMKTNKFKILIKPDQVQYLSSSDKIDNLIRDSKNISLDIFLKDILIGFILIKEFEQNKFFIWNFAIDYRYQSLGLGNSALMEIIEILRNNYNAHIITTTCTLENECAIHLFQKNGFVSYEIVNEENVHEINLRLIL